jgi:hypothetical protein
MVLDRFVRPQVPEAKQLIGRHIQCLKLYRRMTRSKDQRDPRLRSLSNAQETLSQGRRIGKGINLTTALHYSTKSNNPRGLGRRIKWKVASKDHSPRHRVSLAETSGRLVVTHSHAARTIDTLLTQDLRRGCGVEMYKIDSKSRGQSAEEECIAPTWLGVLVKLRWREI